MMQWIIVLVLWRSIYSVVAHLDSSIETMYTNNNNNPNAHLAQIPKEDRVAFRAGEKAINSEYCDRKWPSLELFLPIGLSHKVDQVSAVLRNEEWYSCFLSTFMMFWPTKLSGTSLLLLVDDEMKNSTLKTIHVDRVLQNIQGSPNLPKINVKYHVKTMNYTNGGHDRQQHMMLYADDYTAAEYVGFVDTDAMFFTALDREDIFEDNKPVVHGRIGVLWLDWEQDWAASTYNALGIEEPMICMNYFPMVFKRAHLKPMREHISKHYNLPFDEAFMKFSGTHRGSFSQFSFMCAYAWTYLRSEYVWRVQDRSPTWNGVSRPRPSYGQIYQRDMFSADMYAPKPFVALHARYYSGIGISRMNKEQLFMRGICHGEPEGNVYGLDCKEYLKVHNDYFDEMTFFENYDFTKTGNITWMMELQKERQVRLKGCDKSHGHHEILRVFGPADDANRGKYQALLPLTNIGHIY